MLKRLIISLIALVAVAEPAHAAPYFGSMDTVNPNSDGMFHGWLCDAADPNLPQTILIYRDGNYVGRTSTGVFRPDVAAGGFCLGNSSTGWRFSIPQEEFTGVRSSWSATIEVLAPNADAIEFPHPNFGATSVAATLPRIARIAYIAPLCFLGDAGNGGIIATPGVSQWDNLASFWNFFTRVSGAPPLDPATTYDAGFYTGTSIPAEARIRFQRGDNRNSGVAIDEGRSVLQRYCYSAGIMVNSFWLDANEWEKGGQHGVVWSFKNDRKLKIGSNLRNNIGIFQPGRINNFASVRRPFADGSKSSALVLEGDIQIPWFYTGGQNPSTTNGQANFYVYFWDTSSGKEIAVVMGLWDSRHPKTAGCDSTIRNDAFTMFASQLRCDPSGPYATFDTSVEGIWDAGQVFPRSRKFRVSITGENLLNIIRHTNLQGDDMSPDLYHYALTSAVFGTEINGLMSLGASISNMSVYLSR
ncbi:hypothetical protein BH11PSE11_BH11PSE11_06670 [soil metagenome]